jgi:hypothetical protein
MLLYSLLIIFQYHSSHSNQMLGALFADENQSKQEKYVQAASCDSLLSFCELRTQNPFALHRPQV